jgi:hypothetical protein
MPSVKTTVEEAQVPLPIRVFKSMADGLDGMGLNIVPLKFDKLKESAERQTGLKDWGDPQFLQDINTFIEFVNNNPNAGVVTRISVRAEVLRRLTNYLKIREAHRQHPDLKHEPINKPFIIVGFPRTGTTLLQRLMSRDPNSRGPTLRELFNPVQILQESPDHQSKITAAENFVKTVQSTSMQLWGIHPMESTEPDECFFMMPHTIGDLTVYAPMGYFEWYMKRSALPDYQLHKQYLQALQYKKSPRRWVLKSPLHMPKLDDMLTVYPDALVIQCHRSLGHVMGSWLSYMAVTRKVGTRQMDLHKTGKEMLQIWKRSLDEAMKARAKRSEEQFFDMYYDQLVGDPLAMVKRIYTHFGIVMSPESEAMMRSWLDKDKSTPKMGHSYRLEQFGLTPADLEEAFADYINKFNVHVL